MLVFLSACVFICLCFYMLVFLYACVFICLCFYLLVFLSARVRFMVYLLDGFFYFMSTFKMSISSLFSCTCFSFLDRILFLISQIDCHLGSAMDALSSMDHFLRSRPATFSSEQVRSSATIFSYFKIYFLVKCFRCWSVLISSLMF